MGTKAAAGRAKLSAFVISYNRAALLRTCLSALAFADEVIVIDKSSTDDSREVAAALADRVIRVPWSPTVEDTRAFALAACSHEWILCLDDDECLSPEAVLYIDAELRAPRADIYAIPLRHYILGRHDERAYYWPETHPRLFRRGAVSYGPVVHGGTTLHSERRFEIPAEGGVCIHHLSHRDTTEWVAKTNRYTSCAERARPEHEGGDLIEFAHRRIDFWLERSRPSPGDDYPAAVAVLRAVYDMIDRVKTWEEQNGSDGHVGFPVLSQRLESAYAERLAHLRRPRGARIGGSCRRWIDRARSLVERARATPPDPIGAIKPEEIAFPFVAAPAVTVIVPTFGQVDLTLRCLASMARNLPETAIGVVVVDDASADPDVSRLARVSGIQLVSQPTNLGYLRTCNAAAARARTEFVLFLNNDTLVLPGWLDAMVALLRARDDAGAVGSKLLFPDGRLQEAGGIIWNDATGWTFGRGDRPDRSAYNYVREVDYVSGASLLVRRSLFNRLGGFDEAFAPAYCEDSDLAFRLRAEGYKVLYQPRSQVIHLEGGTNGTDSSQGVKRFNDINQDKLRAKWGAVLAAEHACPGTPGLRARERGRDRRIVLVVAEAERAMADVPAILDDLLAADCAVKLLVDGPRPEPRVVNAWQDRGIEVLDCDTAGAREWIRANGAELDQVMRVGEAVAEQRLADLVDWVGADRDEKIRVDPMREAA